MCLGLSAQLAFAIVATAALVACSGHDDDESAVCTDGQNQACVCPDGTTGQTTCDEGVFGACGCPDQDNAGDVGQACTPQSSGECRFACLELSDGTGVCIDECGAGSGITCPAPFRCDQRVDGSGEPISVCLPTSSCGALTFQGECSGSVLRFCDTEGPVELDCAQIAGADGSPLTCGFVNQDLGNDCVPGGFTGGCGMETPAGRCDGNAVVQCESVESGRVVRIECPAGQECGIGPEGQAECRMPGSAGCGTVTFQGFCEGDTLVYCNLNETEVERVDCAANNRVCGFVNDEIGYNCVEPPPIGGSQTATGRFLFEKRPLTRSGLGAAVQAPVRQALVQVRRDSDNAILASGTTDNEGRFAIGYEAATDVYVAVFTVVSNNAYDIAVRDCPRNDCGGIGNVYAVRSRAFSPTNPPGLDGIVVPQSSGAGAFNIFDVFVSGFDFAQATFGRKPPAVTAQWAPGSNTACNTSCFVPSRQTVYVLGTSNDTDEYDDPVLGHEFGHFLERNFSRSDSPGGFHDGSPTDPRLAWGEGYGTYVGSEIFGSSLYLDSRGSGVSVTDISNTRARANPNDGRGQTQLMSEYVVSEILWKLSKGGPSNVAFGRAPIFDVLGGYFPSANLVDRGVSGVDLVDFLDGWFCRGHGNRSQVRSLVTDELGFPYDYAGPDRCP